MRSLRIAAEEKVFEKLRRMGESHAVQRTLGIG